MISRALDWVTASYAIAAVAVFGINLRDRVRRRRRHDREEHS